MEEEEKKIRQRELQEKYNMGSRKKGLLMNAILPLKLAAVPLNHEGGYNFLDAFEYDALSWLVGKNYFRKVNTAKKNIRNMK